MRRSRPIHLLTTLAALGALLAATAAAADTVPAAPSPWYPFDGPTRVSEPYDRDHHLAVIESRDTAARLFRAHPGLKIKEGYVVDSDREWTSGEYRCVDYTYYLPIEDGRKIVVACYYVADDTGPPGDTYGVRWGGAGISDLTTATPGPASYFSDSDTTVPCEYVPFGVYKYRAWGLSAAQLVDLLAATDPVFVPPPGAPAGETQQDTAWNIFELVVDPNRWVDTSDTEIVVEGTLPATLTADRAATLAVAALVESERTSRERWQQIEERAGAAAEPPKSLPVYHKPDKAEECGEFTVEVPLEVDGDYNAYQVPARLRENPPALASIGRRVNPIVHLYPYAPNRVLAKVGIARFAAQDDPTVITAQFDGWTSGVENVVLEWDGSRWLGRKLALLEMSFTIYN